MKPTPDMIDRQARDAARQAWEAAQEGVDEAHTLSASLNADDTSIEEGFEVGSVAWHECAILTLQRILDTLPDDAR